MRTKYIVAAILLFCLAGISGNAVFAKEGGVTLQLSPVRQSLTVSPGKTGQIRVTVSNPTSQLVTLQPNVDNFTTYDANGTPALIDPSSAGSRNFKEFIQPLGFVTIPPGSDEVIKLQVNVPEGTAPGGYYGALRFVPTGNTSNTAVSASAASLILLTVPGNAKEALTLDSFKITSPAPAFGNYWLNGGKTSVALSFNNQGDIHEAPIGQVYIKRGKEVVSKADFNQTQPHSYILPGSHRSWQLSLDTPNEFGTYTIGAVFTYGSKNQTIEISQTYWVVPLRYVIGGAIGLLLLCLLGVTLYLRRSSSRAKRWSAGR